MQFKDGFCIIDEKYFSLYRPTGGWHRRLGQTHIMVTETKTLCNRIIDETWLRVTNASETGFQITGCQTCRRMAERI